VCTPFVIEPALGLNRLLLAMFCDGLREETLPGGDTRLVFHCAPELAPLQASILPLTKGPELMEDAEKLHKALLPSARVELDAAGSIGKRYRRGDEDGTPLCITIDAATRGDGSVTVRDRDTMRQVRVTMQQLVDLAERRQLLPSKFFPRPPA
jgi:glycyl-tRNA synthetase